MIFLKKKKTRNNSGVATVNPVINPVPVNNQILMMIKELNPSLPITIMPKAK